MKEVHHFITAEVVWCDRNDLLHRLLPSPRESCAAFPITESAEVPLMNDDLKMELEKKGENAYFWQSD